MRTVAAGELLELATDVLVVAGVGEPDAQVVARSLVESNLVGHDSHGVRRLVAYTAAIRDGRVDPRAQPVAERTRPGTVVVHGRRALGQLAANAAVRELLAVDHGSGVAVIRECNHVGRLGEYVADLARHDRVAMAFGNADPTVAPFGGRERRLGTNPLAWAVPREQGRPPVVMDWATSGVAEGKLAVARDRDEQVADGLVLDSEGRTTRDPGDFYAGGVLLPFGGHKGYGLSVLIEIVGGLLTGAGIGSMPDYTGDFGTVLMTFAIDAFQPAAEFRAATEAFCRHLAETAPAQGHDEVLVPGEPEERTRAVRQQDGIPITETTWQELTALLRTEEERR